MRSCTHTAARFSLYLVNPFDYHVLCISQEGIIPFKIKILFLVLEGVQKGGYILRVTTSRVNVYSPVEKAPRGAYAHP